MFWALSVVAEVTLNVFGLEEFGDVNKGNVVFKVGHWGCQFFFLVVIGEVN